MAYGEEQSIRILPSQSTVMNRKVGSTTSLTTAMSRPHRSAIRGQYATLEPPSGSTPIRTPERLIASTSTTCGRSST